MYQHLRTWRSGSVEHLELNRPDVRNALNDLTIAELSAWAEAIADAKRLLREIWHRPPRDVQGLMAESIASRRASAEAQEGMRAFLEKRAPSWKSEK